MARPPVTVLMTADTIGGIWCYALDLAAGLASRGVRTVLATMGQPPSEAQRGEAAAVPGLRLEESAFRLEWMSEADEHVRRAGHWLLELESRHRPDVIHVNGFAHAGLPWQRPCVAVAHSCVSSWWWAVRGEAAPQLHADYARTTAAGLHAADVVVTPTKAFLHEIVRHYGPLGHARVIRNGCEPALHRAGPKREVVFSAGRVWDAAKNVAALDAVAPRLPWPVVVAGDWCPPDGAGVPPANLLCLSVVERTTVRRWLAEAAIFASPARYEPFGLAVLEAACSGCALVLGDIPTLRELWEDSALFVPPDDVAALERALISLIAEPERRSALARAASRRAQRYTIARTTDGYLDAYEDAAAIRAARTTTATSHPAPVLAP